MEENNDLMRNRGNHGNASKTFLPGEKVWLEAVNIHSNRPSRKLDNRRYGPFEVVEKVGDRAYRMKLPESWAIHDIFHHSLLTRCHKPEFDSQRRPMPPPPDIINEEEEYEVEEIRGY